MKKRFYIATILILILFSSLPVTAEVLPTPSYINAFVYSSGRIRLSWDNSSGGSNRYTIQRKTDSGSYTTLTTVPSNVSTYDDTSITNGHTYTYRVFITGGGFTGQPAESYPVEYLLPTGLSTKALSSSEVQLTWTYPTSNKIPETNFQTVIERRAHGSNTWQAVGTIPGTETSFTDTGLKEATRYYYRVRALTATSAIYLYYPNNTSGQAALTLLEAPSNVTAKIVSTKAIELSWNDVSTMETSYSVYRKKGNGTFAHLKTLGANTESFIDNSVVNGEQYTYMIKPISSSYIGSPSEEVTVPFLFPDSLEMEAHSRQIILSWSYPGDGYVKPDSSVVLIERRAAGTLQWEQIHTTRPGETEYTDNGLDPGIRYYYRIRARYPGGFITDYLPTSVGISGFTKLDLNTSFYGYALSDTEIRLEWNEQAAGNANIILEKLGSTGSYQQLASLKNAGHYIDTVQPGSLNSYRLKFKTTTVESDYTPVIDVAAETLPAVTDLTIKAIITDRIFLTWETDDPLESGFEVWRLASSEGVWKLIGRTGRGQPMYSDENINNNESYRYRVRSMKSNTIFSPFVETDPIHVYFTDSAGNLVISMSGDTLYLGWDDFSQMEKYYIVEYKTSAYDAWHVLEKLPKNTTLYRFKPAPGIDYTLRVRAYSDYPIFESTSNVQFYSTKLPANPSLKDPSIIGAKRVVLTWSDLSDNEDEFIIYRKDGMNGEFRAVGSVEADSVIFDDTSVKPDQAYTYQVRAKNAAGESFGSNEILVQTPVNMEFSDLDSHPWAVEAIETLAQMGIVNGDGRGHFNPSGNITRAEFIKLLVATFSFPETSVGSFKDVNVGDWYHRWVITAYRKGIFEPDKNGFFYPDTPITRQDIVYYTSRAVKAAGQSLEQPPLYILYRFTDYNQVAGYAQSAFAAMNYAGIINGIGDDKLGPLNPATRAEAATIIHRLLQVLEKQERNPLLH